MAFELDIGFTSLTGKREINEDFAAAMLPEAGFEAMGTIAAIADGVSMGGMGREAAQTTVTSLVRDYFATPETWDTTVALDRIIGAQNSWLAGLNRRRRPLCGLTTLTALVLRGQSYALAHVGDTRAYLLRSGRVTQLTHDHAMDHPDFRHKLLRAVGAEDRLLVDYMQGDLLVGDVFILLSDGVHNVVAAKRLQALTMDTAQAVSELLVATALQLGSPDNCTALVVRVLGLLDATLQDANRHAQEMPIPPRLKEGDTFDGLTVMAIVADNGTNLIYQVAASINAAAPRGQLYVLKTLHPQRAQDAQERVMLAHEAWLARRMSSSRAADHLVALHDPLVPEPSGYYLLYAWHGGETLQQMLERNHKFTLNQTITAIAQAARALAGLHRQGVIHRDVKPANLHQGEDGVLRLLNLSLALSGSEPEFTRLLRASTPSYMNPEQWGYHAQAVEGPQERADAQSDLFALGVTAYQLLTHGKLPYGDVFPYQIGRFFRDPVGPSRHNPEVPIWLDHMVLKAVARDKRQRFRTADEFLLALERGASRPLTAPPATPQVEHDPTVQWKVGLGVCLLVNALLIYWLLFLPR